MKRYLLIILLSFLCFRAESATIPAPPSFEEVLSLPGDPLTYFSTLSIKEIQKLAGRRFSLKEKMAVKFFQWKIRNGFIPDKQEVKKGKGKAAMILGIIGIVSLFVPYLNLLSIPCTVLALVFGYQAKKANPEDSKAKTAIILGWIGVGLYVIALAVVIAILANWSFGWG